MYFGTRGKMAYDDNSRTFDLLVKRLCATIGFISLVGLLCWLQTQWDVPYNTNDIEDIEDRSNTLMQTKQAHTPRRWDKTRAGNTVDCCDGNVVKEWNFRHVQKPTRDIVIPKEEDIQFEGSDSRQESFARIFRTREWGGSGDVNNPNSEVRASGGSSTEAATRIVRDTLGCVINDIKQSIGKQVIRMIDIPCGDFRWMSSFLKYRDDIEYTGVDIVRDLINHHRMKWSNHTSWKFRVQDIVAEPLEESYDFIFSRDMTKHLTAGDTIKVLKHFADSKSRFVMLTTYPFVKSNNRVNLEIKGRCHTQDLERAPYSLIPPVCVRAEETANQAYNALWKNPLKQYA